MREGRFSLFQRLVGDGALLKANVVDVRGAVESSLDLQPYTLFGWIGLEVFFIVYEANCERFLVFGLNDDQLTVVLDTTKCGELARWLSEYVPPRPKPKPFVKEAYARCIDVCLRENSVPYPGNFDGIIFSDERTPAAVVEFSRVEYASLAKHMKNLHSSRLGEKFFREDKNRWQIVLDVSKFLSVPNVIIWWDANDDSAFLKGSVEHVRSKEGIVTDGKVVNYSRLLKNVMKEVGLA